MRSAFLAGLVVAMLVSGCGGTQTGSDCASDPAKCACVSDSTCAAPNPRCDTRTGQCVPCLPANDNCPANQHCVSTGPSYRCVAKSACTADADCPSSNGHPGLCCDGMCADPMNDTDHCGSCGNACGAVPNGVGGCLSGSCGVVSCNAGFGDCDARPGNGCEADTGTSLTNCGACGNVCKAAPNTKAACNAGKCEGACNPDFADCDGNPANGCETSTTTNPNNCGACGKACPKLPNTTNVACVNSACVVGACAQGFFDCNKMAADGCESDIQNDPANCSRCGMKCPVPMNAAAACSGGNCGVGKCSAGFDDCDKNVLNGCEQDLLSDSKNCGACGNVCTFNHGVGTFQAGKCVLQACDNGFADCDLNANNGCEIALLNDLKNCGACANACPVPANATASCSQGVCGVGSCMYGWADCNKNINDGCETSVLTVQNCGACGNTCAQVQNAVVACPNAVCAIASCNVGFADCDMKAFNGCEVPTTSDAKNCGGCGIVCADVKNMAGACVGSKCTTGACLKGWGDCNKNVNDGCEVDVTSDPKNCGGCGVVCAQNTPNCFGGVCQAGFTHHDGLGHTWIDNIPTGTLDINQAAAACQTYINKALGGNDSCSLNGCGCGGQNLCVYNISQNPRYTWFYNHDTMGGQVTLNCCGCQPAGNWD